MTKHFPWNCKCKLNSTTCYWKQKWNNKTCQCECKSYQKCEKDSTWNPGTCICENIKYLKRVTDTSVTEYDEIVTVMNNLSKKWTKTMKTNVTNTASINFHSTKSTR